LRDDWSYSSSSEDEQDEDDELLHGVKDVRSEEEGRSKDERSASLAQDEIACLGLSHLCIRHFPTFETIEEESDTDSK